MQPALASQGHGGKTCLGRGSKDQIPSAADSQLLLTLEKISRYVTMVTYNQFLSGLSRPELDGLQNYETFIVAD